MYRRYFLLNQKRVLCRTQNSHDTIELGFDRLIISMQKIALTRFALFDHRLSRRSNRLPTELP